ncbi:MAG: LCP family protein [Patescibacteria group bacterium]|nr:MAG: LCP family protein [Patescibacteria group bacterium]
MRPPKINLLSPGDAPRRRFSFWKGALVALATVVILVPTLFSLAAGRLISAASNLNPNAKDNEKVSIIDQVRRLVGNGEKELRGEERDRINILVLGEGGEGHDGPHLTDTILFVTIRPSTSEVGILSLPRDLWIPLPEGGNGKINAVNAYAEEDRTGSGGVAARDAISPLLSQPIDYYVRVDFSAFKTLIDDVGGVTVDVERTFTDFAYPTDHGLYKKVHFEKGWQTMNGDTALEYVRSRHGNNNEGSDFARSRRQQKVILALKDKLVSFDTLLNPSRVASVLETLQSHVITDMELWEIVQLAKQMRHLERENMVHHVLDDGPEGPLYATTVTVSNGDAYVLLPRKGDWSDVKRLAERILERPASETAAAEARTVRVEIQNGTTFSGLAKKTQDLLTKVGYEIVAIGNAKETNRERTTIYDLTNGGYPEELQTIRNLLGAEVALTLPGYLGSGLTPSNIALSNGQQPTTKEGADFLVVLGQNAAN